MMIGFFALLLLLPSTLARPQPPRGNVSELVCIDQLGQLLTLNKKIVAKERIKSVCSQLNNFAINKSNKQINLEQKLNTTVAKTEAPAAQCAGLFQWTWTQNEFMKNREKYLDTRLYCEDEFDLPGKVRQYNLSYKVYQLSFFVGFYQAFKQVGAQEAFQLAEEKLKKIIAEDLRFRLCTKYLNKLTNFENETLIEDKCTDALKRCAISGFDTWWNTNPVVVEFPLTVERKHRQGHCLAAMLYLLEKALCKENYEDKMKTLCSAESTNLFSTTSVQLPVDDCLAQNEGHYYLQENADLTEKRRVERECKENFTTESICINQLAQLAKSVDLQQTREACHEFSSKDKRRTVFKEVQVLQTNAPFAQCSGLLHWAAENESKSLEIERKCEELIDDEETESFESYWLAYYVAFLQADLLISDKETLLHLAEAKLEDHIDESIELQTCIRYLLILTNKQKQSFIEQQCINSLRFCGSASSWSFTQLKGRLLSISSWMERSLHHCIGYMKNLHEQLSCSPRETNSSMLCEVLFEKKAENALSDCLAEKEGYFMLLFEEALQQEADEYCVTTSITTAMSTQATVTAKVKIWAWKKLHVAFIVVMSLDIIAMLSVFIFMKRLIRIRKQANAVHPMDEEENDWNVDDALMQVFSISKAILLGKHSFIVTISSSSESESESDSDEDEENMNIIQASFMIAKAILLEGDFSPLTKTLEDDEALEETTQQN